MSFIFDKNDPAMKVLQGKLLQKWYRGKFIVIKRYPGYKDEFERYIKGTGEISTEIFEAPDHIDKSNLCEYALSFGNDATNLYMVAHITINNFISERGTEIYEVRVLSVNLTDKRTIESTFYDIDSYQLTMKHGGKYTISRYSSDAKVLRRSIDSKIVFPKTITKDVFSFDSRNGLIRSFTQSSKYKKFRILSYNPSLANEIFLHAYWTKTLPVSVYLERFYEVCGFSTYDEYVEHFIEMNRDKIEKAMKGICTPDEEISIYGNRNDVGFLSPMFRLPFKKAARRVFGSSAKVFTRIFDELDYEAICAIVRIRKIAKLNEFQMEELVKFLLNTKISHQTAVNLNFNLSNSKLLKAGYLPPSIFSVTSMRETIKETYDYYVNGRNESVCSFRTLGDLMRQCVEAHRRRITIPRDRKWTIQSLHDWFIEELARSEFSGDNLVKFKYWFDVEETEKITHKGLSARFLRDSEQMYVEGKKQHHCLYSSVEPMKNGRFIAIAIDKDNAMWAHVGYWITNAVPTTDGPLKYFEYQQITKRDNVLLTHSEMQDFVDLMGQVMKAMKVAYDGSKGHQLVAY